MEVKGNYLVKNKEKIALFIDADNASTDKIDIILSEVALYSVVNIRKAYGKWRSPYIKRWKDVDTIFLVSSDCDFPSLVTRALASSMFVIGFGERKDPVTFVNSCSKFLFLEEVQNQDKPKKSLKHI